MIENILKGLNLEKEFWTWLQQQNPLGTPIPFDFEGENKTTYHDFPTIPHIVDTYEKGGKTFVEFDLGNPGQIHDRLYLDIVIEELKLFPGKAKGYYIFFEKPISNRIRKVLKK